MGRKEERENEFVNCILESLLCFLPITLNMTCKVDLYFNINHKSRGVLGKQRWGSGGRC